MLFPIWLLKNDHMDVVVIWRLSSIPVKDINFVVNGKLYAQRWVKNFSEVLNHPKPQMSFFRGGFPEYDRVTRLKPKHFGLKLYLATGRRIYPQWGGIYDVLLQEDRRDFRANRKCLPFFKMASPEIFFPYLNLEPDQHEQYDICWPCNFEQIRYKGQEFFIRSISRNKELQKLKIVHCGNKPNVGKKLCKKYGVTNIEFVGSVNRERLNVYLNHSKFGLCLSNNQDGCPRVITEILGAATPLIIRTLTRVLPYYKNKGVVEVNDLNIGERIKDAIKNYSKYRIGAMWARENELSFDNIMEKNINSWVKCLPKKK